jgi:hypothetical protein
VYGVDVKLLDELLMSNLGLGRGSHRGRKVGYLFLVEVLIRVEIR